GIEDGRRTFSALLVEIERAGGRRVGELAAANVDRVLGDRIRRQHAENAAAVAVAGRLLLAVAAVTMLLSERRRRKENKHQNECTKNARGHIRLRSRPVPAGG